MKRYRILSLITFVLFLGGLACAQEEMGRFTRRNWMDYRGAQESGVQRPGF